MLSRLAARRRGLLRPTLRSWTCFPAPPRNSRWIAPMIPVSLSCRNSTSGSLVARTRGLKGGQRADQHAGNGGESCLSWHINCLELRAVFLALMHFLPVLGKHQIIVRTDNMVVVSHLNHQGGSRSRNVTFPRFRPHRFALRWSHFTLSILVPLLRMRMRGFHALSSSRFEDVCGPLQHLEKILPSCWCVLVLAAVGLPHQSKGFLTGWEMPFRWLTRCVAILHLSVFGRILLGCGLLSSSFQRGSPRGYLWSGRMVLSAHFCQVLQPGSWYGSGFSGSICLNQPYAVWFDFGPDRAAFLAWRVWYIVPKAWKAHAALSEPMTENVSGYSRNPCYPNRERDAAFAAKLLTLPTGIFSAEKSEEQMARSPVWADDESTSGAAFAPSANEFYVGFRQSARREHSQSVKSSCSVSFPIQRTRVTRVTRDVLYYPSYLVK